VALGEKVAKITFLFAFSNLEYFGLKLVRAVQNHQKLHQIIRKCTIKLQNWHLNIYIIAIYTNTTSEE